MAGKPHESTREAATQEESPAERAVRKCPWCGSENVKLAQRGFTGPTDERDQYISCLDCKRLTYEIVSRNAREMRLGQYRTGGIYRDSMRQTKYLIQRVLKVGTNEVLLYVKPIVRPPSAYGAESPRRGRY